MSTGLVVATEDPAAALAVARRRGFRAVRWPDDGPLLIEQQWQRLGGWLDALTGLTGVRRLSPDEAAALPGAPTIALMLTLITDTDTDTAVGSAPQVLVADPGAMSGLVTTLSHLTYGQRRLLPMPLDLLATMNRKLAAVTAVGTAMSMSEALLREMRDRARWAAVVIGGSPQSRHAARHLALAGMALLPAESSLDQALCGNDEAATTSWFDVTRTGGDYELWLRVPGLCKDSMTLTRAGEYLVVTVDGLAHPIELPSGLRRCVVTGARVREDGVRVRFRPDKESWRE